MQTCFTQASAGLAGSTKKDETLVPAACAAALSCAAQLAWAIAGAAEAAGGE